MNVQPDIAVLVPGWLTRMQAHPDPDRDPAGPVMRWPEHVAPPHSTAPHRCADPNTTKKLSPSVPISRPPNEENAARSRAR